MKSVQDFINANNHKAFARAVGRNLRSASDVVALVPEFGDSKRRTDNDRPGEATRKEDTMMTSHQHGEPRSGLLDSPTTQVRCYNGAEA